MKLSTKVYLAHSNINDAGRGIFAAMKIKKGETIEVCPVILLKDEEPNLRKSELYHYYFVWGNRPDAAVALGFGSVYNHSDAPNATYKKHIKDKTVEFVALEDIDKNEEITINYNHGDPKMHLRFM